MIHDTRRTIQVIVYRFMCIVYRRCPHGLHGLIVAFFLDVVYPVPIK